MAKSELHQYSVEDLAAALKEKLEEARTSIDPDKAERTAPEVSGYDLYHMSLSPVQYYDTQYVQTIESIDNLFYIRSMCW